jgi:hypothetical protein
MTTERFINLLAVIAMLLFYAIVICSVLFGWGR